MMIRPVMRVCIDDCESMNAFSEDRLKLTMIGKAPVKPEPMFPRTLELARTRERAEPVRERERESV